jgi:division protein CdvB (Snf7/Vps24/ESCRT-III family)
MSSEKIDRRVVLQSNSLEELTKIANSLDLDKGINERERLGAAIESLLEIKRQFDKEFIELDQTSKERIHTMIGFGEYASKEAVVASAIEKLFAEHREKIIKKIEAL